MAITKIQTGGIPALAVTHDKLHTTMDLSGKTVTLPSAITDTITNKLPLAGGTLTGNVNFGDGNKAIFGAELEIYSDATHARIREYGSGQMKIQGDNMQLLTSDGASTYLEGNASSGVVTLYHASNAPRIATASFGAQITGSLAVDTITNATSSTDVTIDTNFDIILDAGGNVGIGTTSPSQKLHVDSGSTDTVALFESSGDASAYLVIKDSGSSGGAFIGAIGTHTILGTGGSTERMRIDSSGNVGIGRTTPQSKLEVWTGNGELSHFGSNNANADTNYTGITLGYAEAGANSNYRKVGIVSVGRGDGAARQDLAFLVDSQTDGNSVDIGDTKMRISHEGYVTTPSQPHLYGTPHNGTEASSGQATVFRVKTSRGGLSFSNSRVTVPVAGVYMITYQTICQTDTGRHDTLIKINGTQVSNGLNENNGTGYHQRTHVFNMYLNVNDYITWHNERYYANGGVFDAWTNASVTLIG